MANDKFTDLPTVASALTTDIIAAVQADTSVQQTLSQVITLSRDNIVLNYPGNPNGNLAGTTYQLCWDTVNSVLYVCRVSGTIVTAVWAPATSITIPVPVTQGGTGLTSTTANQILYSSANNVIAGLPTGVAGVLKTDFGGVPSISNVLPGGLTIPYPSIFGTNGNIVATFNDETSNPDWLLIKSGDSGILPAGVSVLSTNSNANLQILAKGTGSIIAGSLTTTIIPMSLYNGSNYYHFQIPSWTGNRALLMPDGDVTLVAGTMANAPINTNITQMNNLETIGTNSSPIATFVDTGGTNYLTLANGENIGAPAGLYANGTNANLGIFASGTGVVGIGTSGPNPVGNYTALALVRGSSNVMAFTIPDLTAPRTLLFPDSDVNLSSVPVLNSTPTANQILLSGSSTIPAWSTSTFPPTSPINSLLYASAANVLSNLAPQNNAYLTSNSSGAPTWITANSIYTPTITFFVPGDLSVAYTNQIGYYFRIGNLVIVKFRVDFTPTYTTAGSGFFISLPLPVAPNGPFGGNFFTPLNAASANLTYPAGTTNVVPRAVANSSLMAVVAYGSAVSSVTLQATDIPSGVAQAFEGMCVYITT